jgi:hypothetical protein
MRWRELAANSPTRMKPKNAIKKTALNMSVSKVDEHIDGSTSTMFCDVESDIGSRLSREELLRLQP